MGGLLYVLCGTMTNGILISWFIDYEPITMLTELFIIILYSLYIIYVTQCIIEGKLGSKI